MEERSAHLNLFNNPHACGTCGQIESVIAGFDSERGVAELLTVIAEPEKPLMGVYVERDLIAAFIDACDTVLPAAP